ncbi:MAG: hypothetical protein LHW44_03070 [Candidatus Cloacimonetes bacterium]|nr:hypothetical protein [Candidatus Cloacimonadota bacterium]
MMIDPKIEHFLEKADMNYLFCLLSKLEAGRLSQLPAYVRNKLGENFAVLSMQHVADNDIPDYITEIAEAELLAAQESGGIEPSPFDADEGVDSDLNEETIDDSLRFTNEPPEEVAKPWADDDDDDDDDDQFADDDDDDDLDDDE